MRIALLAADSRQVYRQYDRTTPAFGTPVAALIDGFSRRPEIELHVVSCTQEPMVSPGMLARNVWFHSVPVPKWGWMRTLYWGCSAAVRRRLEAIQPDLVHGQGTERECAITAVRSGRPGVITVHGNMRAIARHFRARPLSFHWLAARLEVAAIRRARGVVCLSTYGAQMAAALARRTWRVPNAVDAGLFETVRAVSAPPLLLCVGSICREKGQIALIEALEPLAKAHAFRLAFHGHLIAGENYDQEFTQLVARHAWCEFRGFADRPALAAALSEATALLHPTLEDNCPMAVLEALAVGVPVIASRIGGLPDLIEDGRNGFLCDPQNPKTFADAVAQLLSDPARAAAMSDVSRAEARRQFHPDVIADAHVAIYREVLGTA